MKAYRWLVAVVFIGALTAAGGVYAHDGDGQGGGQDGGWKHHHGAECAKHHLPEAKMKLLHQAMMAAHEKDKPLHEEAKNLHKQLKDVIGAKNFDEQKFVALSTRLGEIHAKIREDHVKAFASVAGQLTPEERKHVIRMWMHRHGHHGHHGHHGNKNGGWKHEGRGGPDGEHHEWHAHDGYQGQQSYGQPDNSVVNSTPMTPDRDYPPYAPR